MWHASVATVGKPVASLNEKQRKRMEQTARAILEGVGIVAEEGLQWGIVSVSVRRPLVDGELQRLDPRWLALPAIDDA